MHSYLQQVLNRQSLSREQAQEVLRQIMGGQVPPEQVAALLGALRVRGETLDELTGFASVMREHAVSVPIQRTGLLDTCGTGGDGSGTFNISTAVAFVLAAAGVPVAKHGNRSVSGLCGSADVLETLGIPVSLPLEQVGQAVDEVGLGFFFAPAFHPALKHVAPVRRALAVRTVFNLLGPLCNPARTPYQVLGIFDGSLVDTMAAVLRELGAQEVMVLHGDDGLDELTLSAPTRVAHLKDGKIETYHITPEQVGLQRVPREAVQGGDAATNAAILQAVLAGEPGPPRDIVLFNAAAGLMVTRQVNEWADGVALAAATIDEGKALAKLESLRHFCLSHQVR